MPHFRAAVLAAALLAGCGTAVSSAKPTPTPKPAPPDTEVVDINGEGVGTFDLVAMPVAVIRNLASQHAALQVVVTFQTKRNSAKLGALAAVPVSLDAGQTMAVAADCTDRCNGANAVDVTVKVGAWSTSQPAAITTATAVQYSCGSCGAGHGYGQVSGVLQTASPRQSGAVTAFAACYDGVGSIIGGGQEQLTWGSGNSLPADVPVIVNQPPARCRLFASATW